jgi:hypothetical protein
MLRRVQLWTRLINERAPAVVHHVTVIGCTWRVVDRVCKLCGPTRRGKRRAAGRMHGDILRTCHELSATNTSDLTWLMCNCNHQLQNLGTFSAIVRVDFDVTSWIWICNRINGSPLKCFRIFVPKPNGDSCDVDWRDAGLFRFVLQSTSGSEFMQLKNCENFPHLRNNVSRACIKPLLERRRKFNKQCQSVERTVLQNSSH